MVTTRMPLVAVLLTVTVAPATAAPVESLTSPVTVPSVWPGSCTAFNNPSKASAHRTHARIL